MRLNTKPSTIDPVPATARNANKKRVVVGTVTAVVALATMGTAWFVWGHMGDTHHVPDGLSINTKDASPGYSLIAPMNLTSTYLIDMQGRVVHEWRSEFTPGLSAYLLKNGHLLRAGVEQANGFNGPGTGGRIQEFTWDGELVWDFSLSTERVHPHHDICRLPNGNVLVIATDLKPAEEAVAAGRNPMTVQDQLKPDCLLEIKPTGTTTGEIVWEWHAWDHLVQDFDDAKPNHGKVAAHPELIDINFSSNRMDGIIIDSQQLRSLKSLGYIGAANKPTPDRLRTGHGFTKGDWMHSNSVAYNAELDQIMLSVFEFSEVWIIDHGTTTEEAASHTGGRRGKGGDLLYRWGNAKTYDAGDILDQRLFSQHSAHWIPAGLPGAGHLLVFNNGLARPGIAYSSVDEVELPLTAEGTYSRPENEQFGPESAAWSYTAPQRFSFYAMLVSGAQRLSNGDTLICEGKHGVIFETTPQGRIVWRYKLPGVDDDEPRPGREQAPTSKKPPTASTNKPRRKGPGGLFRCYRYGADSQELAGKDLKPGEKLEDVVAKAKVPHPPDEGTP